MNSRMYIAVMMNIAILAGSTRVKAAGAEEASANTLKDPVLAEMMELNTEIDNTRKNFDYFKKYALKEGKESYFLSFPRSDTSKQDSDLKILEKKIRSTLEKVKTVDAIYILINNP